tara:strand:- start:13320 stop:13517 length:198 start_codon:yes stop_codon:yes gene_type:complete
MKNKKIIFIGKLNLVEKILDFKQKIPKQQNRTKLKLIEKLPKIKLRGNKAKTKLVSEFKFILFIF